MKNFCSHLKLFSVLALISGLVHLIPQLYSWLSNLTGGTPWIQIVVGALTVIFALVILFSKECTMCIKGAGEAQKM